MRTAKEQWTLDHPTLDEEGCAAMVVDAMTDLEEILKYLPTVKKSDKKKLRKYLKELERGEDNP